MAIMELQMRFDFGHYDEQNGAALVLISKIYAIEEDILDASTPFHKVDNSLWQEKILFFIPSV